MNDEKNKEEAVVVKAKKKPAPKYLIAKKTKVINKLNKDVDWNKAQSLARKAQQSDKTKLCLELLGEKKVVEQTELQIITGWDSNNLHSRFRKEFCEKHGVVFNKKEKTFSIVDEVQV